MQILCADNSPVSLLGIRSALAGQGFEIRCEVSNPKDLVNELTQTHYELIISEFRFGDNDLLDFIDEIRDACVNVKILIYTFHLNPTYVARSSSHQLFDFVAKNSGIQRLMSSVACAATGVPPIDSLLSKSSSFLQQTPPSLSQNPSLTKREVQILVHLSLGLSNREISQALSISLETVKEHVQNVLRKLNASDRTEAAVWALRNGVPRLSIEN